MRVALAGNPNSGKTSLFNELTGANQYVGNWPGVTVERKGGRLRGREDVEIIDLPGIYSLSPYTPEEVVARRHLLEERPDLVVNVVDATNLERNLYLTSQLLETGLPVVIALNMTDLLERRRLRIDTAALGEALGCPVLEASGFFGKYVYHKEVNFKSFHDVDVAGLIHDADVMIDFSHVKGHGSCGYGGACKNIAMGCVTDRTRHEIHALEGGLVWDKDKCVHCGKCIDACNHEANSFDSDNC